MTTLSPTMRTGMALRAVMEPHPFPPAAEPGELAPIDVYDLPRLDLTAVTGIVLAGDVDQLFLLEHRAVLDGFVRGGGRILVNGHVQRPFITGLTRWRRLSFNHPDHLRLQRRNDHPVWAGTDPEQFLYSSGTPRPTDAEDLARLGVAGFYGRGYYLDLPPDSTVIHTIGAADAPIDYEYRLGAGRVLVHGGNDLTQFISAERGTAHLREQLHRWLEER